MNISITKCDELSGRMQAICSGTARLPLSTINIYRARWGMPPLADDGRKIVANRARSQSLQLSPPTESGGCCKNKSRRAARKQPASREEQGPGWQLTKHYEKLGAPPCQQCKDLANKMDLWGVDTCRQRLDEIVTDILPRAKKWVDKKVGWFAALVPDMIEDAALKFKIRRDVNAAINAAEEAVKRTAPPKCKSCGSQRAKKPGPRITQAASADESRLLDPTLAVMDVLQHRQAVCAACPLATADGCQLLSRPLRRDLAAEECPAGKWFRQTPNRRPLVNPVRNLIFHLYPLLGAEWNWHWHLDHIRQAAPLFNGKIAIAAVTGPNLATEAEVRMIAANIPVTHWSFHENSPLAETVTMPALFGRVQTSDHNEITLRGHTKGVTKSQGGVEQPWARLMWDTCLDLPSVEDALASHVMAGPMKCHQPLVPRRKGDWFYAGSFYWFRSDVFDRDWGAIEQNRWWVEYWPGHVASNDDAACLCHNYTKGSVLNNPYWHAEVQADYERWKSARAV